MSIRHAIAAAAALAIAAGLAATASAIPRNCPEGQTWDPNQGSCVVKEETVRRASPAKKYYDAIRILESARPRPKRAVRLLRQACRARHAPACTLLGYLYFNGEAIAFDAAQSLRYYTRGCELEDANGCIGAAEVHSRGLLDAGVDHAKAARFLKDACAQGSGKGCHQLGDAYWDGRGVKQDYAAAKRHLKRAYDILATQCPERGDVVGGSCHLVGMSHLTARVVDRDVVKAFEAFDRGCTAGNGDACYELGIAKNQGSGTPKDAPAALAAFDKACTRYDHAGGCREAGVIIALGKVAMDERRLRSFGERACRFDKKHCDLLGYIYGKGLAGRVDEAKAAEHYVIACERGARDGCNLGGDMLWDGKGTAADPKRAVEMWERGCELENEWACMKAGEKLHNGERGIAEDAKRSHELFRAGCEQDHAKSCHWVGFQIDKGTDGTGEEKPADAKPFYEKGCELGRTDACNDLAELYLEGRGVAKDEAKARALYETSCEGTNWAGCRELGKLYFFAEGDARDTLAAGRLFAKACSHGDPDEVCWWIDSTMRKAEASDADKKKALDLLVSACHDTDSRNETACLALGRLYAFGGYITARAPRKAFELFAAGCERGRAKQCVQLAHMYSSGIGVVADPNKAVELFTEQCNAGTEGACAWLGIQLRDQGKYEAAANLFRRACDEGDATGCNSIGFAHYTAQGVRWDVEAAAKGYRKACELGLAVGCSNVGELLEHGIAGDKDLAKALEFYQKGCTPAQSVGCPRVGHFYEHGLGGAKVDLDRAEREYERGCADPEWSSAEACRWLAELYRESERGSATEIAQLAQKAFDLARENAGSNPYGAYVLGTMYRDGVSVVKDPAKAAEQFERACEGYDPLGCRSAGEMYLGDSGLDPAYEKAAVLFDRACAAGMADACDRAGQARKWAIDPPPRTNDPNIPMSGSKAKGCGCAAHGASGDTFGGVVLIVMVAVGLRRRRVL